MASKHRDKSTPFLKTDTYIYIYIMLYIYKTISTKMRSI